MEIGETVVVRSVSYKLKALLGKGKGGYSFLASSPNGDVVVKFIHHEPCDYYQFGDKLQSELDDYKTLKQIGLLMPKLLAFDKKHEIIIKEFIDGPLVSNLVKENKLDPKYIEEMSFIATTLKNFNLNIDYYPTNFIIRDEKIYYVDYECNEYHDEWSFSTWGISFWKEFKEEK